MTADLSWWIQVALSLLVVQVVVGSWWLVEPGKKLVDGGWVWGKLSAWLVVSLLVWWGGVVWRVNTVWVVRGLMAGLLIVAGVYLITKRESWRREVRKKWRFILMEEGLFVMGLVGIGLVRGFKPEILGLEKFMDAGLINRYLHSPGLPAEDMWLAGKTINYYSFGHFVGSVMLRWWGVGIGVGYNLLLALLAGLVLAGSFSASVNLISLDEKSKWKSLMAGGLISSLLVTLGGNSQVIWYGIKNKGWSGYWYPNATRFIENTIHEFASYSLVVADLHAHLWGLPVVLMLLVLLVGWRKAENKLGWEIGWGVLVGVLAMTNTWDVLVYGLLLVIWVGWLTLKGRLTVGELLRVAGVTLAVAGLVSLTWWISFESIGQGVGLVEKRSIWWQLMVLWGGHGLLTMGAVSKAWLKKNRLVISMGLGALLLILIPEVVYIKDIYPTHPRANTMFKLTYQAMLWMSLLVGYLAAKCRRVVKVGVMVLVVGFLSYTWFAYRDFYHFDRYQGLDGTAWLKGKAADDWQGIEWLKKNTDKGAVIMEAVGESYTEFGRVSVFSGRPTVLGWRVHEWLWRGGFEEVAERTKEVRAVYEEPRSELAGQVLDKYGVGYIFVGSKEKEEYELAEKEVGELGKTVFSKGRTKIIEIAD